MLGFECMTSNFSESAMHDCGPEDLCNPEMGFDCNPESDDNLGGSID